MPKRPSKAKRFFTFLFGLIVIFAILGYYAKTQIQPMPSGKEFYVRYNDPLSLNTALQDMQKRQVVRNAGIASWYARYKKTPRQVKSGTYQFKPGMTLEEVLASLQKPIRQMVRIPETYWASRVGTLLEQKGVATKADYMKWVNDPQAFQKYVKFPLPKSGSLEGYLYPDTYDLPPLLGAQQTIIRQLKNFEKRVASKLDPNINLTRAVVIGSMVQLEVAQDQERPIVAGVIENRIKLGMPLQIDATILYGLQEWRRLTFKDYREANTPYNTYRRKGLPPGPICSPGQKSIEAALSPAKHTYLYYVALPEGRHMFSSTYPEHLKNIEKRKAALAKQAQQKP